MHSNPSTSSRTVLQSITHSILTIAVREIEVSVVAWPGVRRGGPYSSCPTRVDPTAAGQWANGVLLARAADAERTPGLALLRLTIMGVGVHQKLVCPLSCRILVIPASDPATNAAFALWLDNRGRVLHAVPNGQTANLADMRIRMNVEANPGLHGALM